MTKKKEEKKENSEPSVEDKQNDELFKQSFWHEELALPWWKRLLRKLFGV